MWTKISPYTILKTAICNLIVHTARNICATDVTSVKKCRTWSVAALETQRLVWVYTFCTCPKVPFSHDVGHVTFLCFKWSFSVDLKCTSEPVYCFILCIWNVFIITVKTVQTHILLNQCNKVVVIIIFINRSSVLKEFILKILKQNL